MNNRANLKPHSQHVDARVSELVDLAREISHLTNVSPDLALVEAWWSMHDLLAFAAAWDAMSDAQARDQARGMP